MLPNLQTQSNDRMLVTRLQPGPFSGYRSKLKDMFGSDPIPAKRSFSMHSITRCTKHTLSLTIKGASSKALSVAKSMTLQVCMRRYSMFHCHFLHHEDTGCAAVAQW